MMKLDPHYTNPKLATLYDLDSPWGEDTDFYIAFAGAEPLTIADVGCGTGTLACGLAAAGHSVIGVDPAESMLTVAKAKPLGDKVQWLNRPADQFVLAAPVDLITMTGHAFQVLLQDSDISGALVNFATHLKPGGMLVFESRNPDIDWNKIWGTKKQWQTDLGLVRQIRSNYSRQGEYVSFRHSFYFHDGVLVSDSTLRFASCDKIRSLIQAAGLELKTIYGDWQGSPFQPESEEMIFVAVKP